ncbi:hypothetical protein AV926_04775 [Myroides marinus]|uniref:Uncharacterized protein n=1 Tax=Myroides marinus TaxID=703342 RepID=A0A161SL27_9FLAO|nr:hypothetical protein [Myroides marinus]KZE82865.1 hypothetical protein AV926_04775 [Myroides marinus]
MKHLLLIITLLLSTASFAQFIAKDEIDKFTDDRKIQINATKGDATWGTSDSFTKNIFRGGLYLSSHITVTPNKEIYSHININVQTSYMVCFGQNKIIALFENGDKVTLNQVSKIDCGNNVNVMYDISDKDINIFKNLKLKEIRLYTADGYLDFVVKDNMKKVIQGTFELTANKLQEIQQ